MSSNKKGEVSVVSVKGQLVIPRRIRKDFGIEEGTRVLVSVQGDSIILKPLTAKHYRTLRGLLA